MTTYLQTGMVDGGAATVADITALRDLFIGIEVAFPFLPDAPWLPLFGQTINSTDYPKLAARWGFTGDKVLPDMRDRVIAGYGVMGGAAANLLNSIPALGAIGGVGGSQQHTLTIGQMPEHDHTLSMNTVPDHTHSFPRSPQDPGVNPLAADLGNGTGASSGTTGAAGGHTPTGTIGKNGSGQAHNNVQPTIIQYICILAE